LASTVPRKPSSTAKGTATPKKAASEKTPKAATAKRASANGRNGAAKAADADVLIQLRAREAELAMLTSVQQALAARLDMAAMYRLVGDKIGEITDSQVVGIRLFEGDDKTVAAPYLRERGELIEITERVPIGPLAAEVQKRRASFLINDLPAWEDEHGVTVPVPYGERTKSVMFAPLMSGEEVRGYITLQNIDRVNAFSQGDLDLLMSVASSLSLALDNANLFAETEQRNAELAVINEIGEALAKQLDFQGIIDAVGDRIMRTFDVDSGTIRLYDAQTGMVTLPYGIDEGQRFTIDPRPPSGLTKKILETRTSLRLATADEATAMGSVSIGVVEKVTESFLGVPVMAGDRVLGIVTVNRWPKDAFSESDERLLSTIASNLGVALESDPLLPSSSISNRSSIWWATESAPFSGPRMSRSGSTARPPTSSRSPTKWRTASVFTVARWSSGRD